MSAISSKARANATQAASEGSCWPISWDRGQARVFAVGAALHDLVFRLDDGLTVAPLAEAPWIGEPSVMTDAAVPAHLRQLGGEWPCVPFGTTAIDPRHHGFGTDNSWHVAELSEGVIALAIDYPQVHPVKRLERRLAGVPGEPAIDIELMVEARADCVLPVGLHPIFRLAGEGRRLQLDPGPFARGRTFPKVFEPGVSQVKPAVEFSSLDAVLLAGGGTASVSHPPSGLREEIFQIADASGSVRLDYAEDGYQARLDWNTDDFPSLVIWLSDRGRSAFPWSNRFRGIGIEPVNGFFDDISLALHAPQNLSLGRRFAAGEKWSTQYRISASSLVSLQHEGPTE